LSELFSGPSIIYDHQAYIENEVVEYKRLQDFNVACSKTEEEQIPPPLLHRRNMTSPLCDSSHEKPPNGCIIPLSTVIDSLATNTVDASADTLLPRYTSNDISREESEIPDAPYHSSDLPEVSWNGAAAFRCSERTETDSVSIGSSEVENCFTDTGPSQPLANSFVVQQTCIDSTKPYGVWSASTIVTVRFERGGGGSAIRSSCPIDRTTPSGKQTGNKIDS